MSDDLVERLRSVESDLNNGFPVTRERLLIMQEAATRIERLEAALRVFADCADMLDEETKETGREWPDDEWAKFRLLVSDYRIARAALKEGQS